MSKVEAEKVFAFAEEVKGKLLDISLEDYRKENSVERIFPDVLWYSVVEKYLETSQKHEVNEEDYGQLVEEKLQIVGEKADSFLVFAQNITIRVILFIIHWTLHIAVGLSYSLENIVTVTFYYSLGKWPAVGPHLESTSEQNITIFCEILMMQVIELYSIENQHVVGESLEEPSTSWHSIEA